MNSKALYLTSNFVYVSSANITGLLMVLNQLENNDAPANKKSVVQYEHITFNGICQCTKGLFNWILNETALSMKWSNFLTFYDSINRSCRP